MNKVAVCRGDRGGVVYHVYDGYFYRNDSHHKRAFIYLHCTTNGCPGRAVMPMQMEDRIVNNFKMTTLHDHPPNLKHLYINNLKESILSRCESEFTPLKQVFDEELAKAPKEIHGLLTFNNYKSTMSRIRRSIKNSLITVLQDDIDFAHNTDTEDTEHLRLTDDNAGELSDVEDQQEITMNSKRKKASQQKSVKIADKSNLALPDPRIKKTKSIHFEEEISLKRLERDQLEYTLVDVNYTENDCDNQSEACFEDEEVYFEDEEYYEDEEAYSEDQEENLEGGNVYDEHYSEEEKIFENVSEENIQNGNKDENFDVGNEIEILTSEEISETQKQRQAATYGVEKSTYSKTAPVEDVSDDLQKYLKFNKSNPRTSCQFDNLLSIFFKEIEATVRSFLPSVIIEAKGKIANLVNRLEMRNWQVQQELQRQDQYQQELQELEKKQQEIQQHQQIILKMQKQQQENQEEQQLHVRKRQNLQQRQEIQEDKNKEHQPTQSSHLTPENQFQDLQKKQHDILKQQKEILENQKQQLKNHQLEWHKKIQAQQQGLSQKHQQKKQTQPKTKLKEVNQSEQQHHLTQNQHQQHRHTLDLHKQQDQLNVKSSPVVIQYNPNVSYLYLTNTDTEMSTPKVKV